MYVCVSVCESVSVHLVVPVKEKQRRGPDVCASLRGLFETELRGVIWCWRWGSICLWVDLFFLFHPYHLFLPSPVVFNLHLPAAWVFSRRFESPLGGLPLSRGSIFKINLDNWRLKEEKKTLKFTRLYKTQLHWEYDTHYYPAAQTLDVNLPQTWAVPLATCWMWGCSLAQRCQT